MQTAFALEIAGLITCLALSNLGPLGQVAAAVLSLLAFLIGLFGGIFSPGDQASQQDITPSPGGDLHGPDDHGLNADVVMVTGTWVYDSAHEGWNELHPVKSIHRVGVWNGSWDAGFLPESQQKYGQSPATPPAPWPPTYQPSPPIPPNAREWQIHPLIDGCGDYPSFPTPESPPSPRIA